ncbi:Diphthamide biosynthesis protein 2 [Ciborinia camelliae]|nr:Diphthamide biosynthesis protein 2 [Ciborinia camelliae]
MSSAAIQSSSQSRPTTKNSISTTPGTPTSNSKSSASPIAVAASQAKSTVSNSATSVVKPTATAGPACLYNCINPSNCSWGCPGASCTDDNDSPVLSTPEIHIFEDPTPLVKQDDFPKLSDEELYDVYEISRTVKEIREGGWKKIALQFSDGMLSDAPRIFQELENRLRKLPAESSSSETAKKEDSSLETDFSSPSANLTTSSIRHKLFILADTSYGSCCVDEIAAEHVDAQVVVHYGRACLSPTARLPVIYVFTSRPLEHESVVQAFENTYPEKDSKIVIMADITYHSHIPSLVTRLQDGGYGNILAPEITHDPSAIIPNRKLEEGVDMKEYSLFHISEPPSALLLTLSSRVRDMHIYSTDSTTGNETTKTNTARALMRRYALLTSLSSCPVFGILINTLSVTNYLPTVNSLASLIRSKGKKSYTFVVGKVNAAKLANFSEIEGWVVVGCWESSLVEGEALFKPVITPFELALALQSDDERVWSGDWVADFNALNLQDNTAPLSAEPANSDVEEPENGHATGDAEDSEEESMPPEFDLRTGRYVSHSRPMRSSQTTSAESKKGLENGSQPNATNKLVKRAKMELATVNGEVSPGAEYLREKRTWTGLGSDYDKEAIDEGREREVAAVVEEGRSGVARGYTVGEDASRS